MDEAGVYLLPFLSRTWAPTGQTPVLNEPVDRVHLSIIAALSPSGHLIHQVQSSSFDGESIVEFLQVLMWHYRKTGLLIIWDRATIHRDKIDREWSIRQRMGQATMGTRGNSFSCLPTGRQPPYSPEVKPVELVWNALKQCRLKNQVFLNLNDLQQAVRRQIYDLQKRRTKLRQFFKKQSVAFTIT